jgi:ribose/xylose/arabinose/galactoside ABC-type transport system permease subunit
MRAIFPGMAVGALCGFVNGWLTAYLALAPFIVACFGKSRTAFSGGVALTEFETR